MVVDLLGTAAGAVGTFADLQAGLYNTQALPHLACHHGCIRKLSYSSMAVRGRRAVVTCCAAWCLMVGCGTGGGCRFERFERVLCTYVCSS